MYFGPGSGAVVARGPVCGDAPAFGDAPARSVLARSLRCGDATRSIGDATRSIPSADTALDAPRTSSTTVAAKVGACAPAFFSGSGRSQATHVGSAVRRTMEWAETRTWSCFERAMPSAAAVRCRNFSRALIRTCAAEASKPLNFQASTLAWIPPIHFNCSSRFLTATSSSEKGGFASFGLSWTNSSMAQTSILSAMKAAISMAVSEIVRAASSGTERRRPRSPQSVM
mmetsp:Transcript_18334/g.61813  ORF Transcript_18334/g.61813 Transcript_18334/m.61813 type:complete len:228 (+) Transcript_18334:212-895(+)